MGRHSITSHSAHRAGGTPIHQSNFLRRSLDPILEKLGIEKQGFHSFRRFRVTHLASNFVPAALIKYWTGHAKSSDGDVQQSPSPIGTSRWRRTLSSAPTLRNGSDLVSNCPRPLLFQVFQMFQAAKKRRSP